MASASARLCPTARALATYQGIRIRFSLKTGPTLPQRISPQVHIIVKNQNKRQGSLNLSPLQSNLAEASWRGGMGRQEYTAWLSYAGMPGKSRRGASGGLAVRFREDPLAENAVRLVAQAGGKAQDTEKRA